MVCDLAMHRGIVLSDSIKQKFDSNPCGLDLKDKEKKRLGFLLSHIAYCSFE
jgi:hypothetical protein